MSSDISTLLERLLAQSTESREDERYFRISLHVDDEQLALIRELSTVLDQLHCQTRWAVTSVDTYDEAYELADGQVCGAERTIIVRKSVRDDKSIRFLRLESLCDWASTQTAKVESMTVAFVADLEEGFATGTCAFEAWTSEDSVEPLESDATYCNPRKIVRTSHTELCPTSIPAWSPKDCQTVPECFAHLCINYLARSLAPELRQENGNLSVFIRGARTHEVKFMRSTGPVDRALLEELVTATDWVFRSEKEADLRHGLLASEIAREWDPDTAWLLGLSGRLPFALKNAETAYALHLHELGSDALEQMGMLRRALSDDAGRLSALMSSIQSAIWRDTALGAGFIVVRLSESEVPGMAAIAVLMYLVISFLMNLLNILGVISVVARDEGRTRARLYHFVQPDDFREIYSDPVGRIRRKLWLVFSLSGVVSLGLCFLILQATELWKFEPSNMGGSADRPTTFSVPDAGAAVPHTDVEVPDVDAVTPNAGATK